MIRDAPAESAGNGICKSGPAWVALPICRITRGTWMERFLVGIDGSECGDRALSAAVAQARASDAQLLVC